VNPSAGRNIFDCGGKRSATPLFARLVTFIYPNADRACESAVAAAALPAQSTT